MLKPVAYHVVIISMYNTLDGVHTLL